MVDSDDGLGVPWAALVLALRLNDSWVAPLVAFELAVHSLGSQAVP